jgi:hypothetical protein
MELLKRLFCVVFVFTAIHLSAQNDDCNTAALNPISTADLDNGGMCVTLNLDNTGATPWLLTPPNIYYAMTCTGTVDSVVFYPFQAQGVSVDISVTSIGGNNPHIELLYFPIGLCDAATAQVLDCVDGNLMTIDNGLTVGETYYIAIGFANQAQGPFDLCVFNPTNQVNDECDFAIPITNLDDVCSVNLDNYYPSTSSNFFPGCWGTNLSEVWFSFVAQGVSIADLHVENFSGTGAAYIAVLEGSCADLGAMVVLGCGANGTPIFSDGNLVVGNTYYITVAFENYASGTFDLCLDNPENPFNDDCMDAPVIPPLELSDELNPMCVIIGETITSDYASTDLYTFNCWNTGDSYNVWFQFVAQGLDLDVSVLPTFAAATQISLVSFGNNPCDAPSGVVIECQYNDILSVDNILTIGETYYIAVGFDNNEPGDFCINAFNPVPPANDTMCAAIPLSTDGSCNSGSCPPGLECYTTEYANPEFPTNFFDPACQTTLENTVWYTITMQDPNNVGFSIDFSQNTMSGNVTVALLTNLSGDCTDPFQFRVFDSYCGAPPTDPIEFAPIIDETLTYYLMVGSSEAGEGSFDICVDEIPPCFDNEFCLDPAGLSSATVIDGLNSTTGEFDCEHSPGLECNLYAEPEPSLTNCGLNQNPVVWYTFTTDANTGVGNIIIESDDIFAPSIMLFTGDCANLTSEALDDEGNICLVGSDGNLAVNAVGMNPNTTYYLAVSGVNTIGGEFELCVNLLENSEACATQTNTVFNPDPDVLGRLLLPGETVNICFTVDNYRIDPVGTGNQCQWFSGVVPIFGTGWDPISFGPDGMPLNSTLNGSLLTYQGNTGGLAGGRWGWWDDVTYNFTSSFYYVGGGEMCNALYDPNCPAANLVAGGILPPGWFCWTPNSGAPGFGHPNVEFGDGNCCNCDMGDWTFCFDLTVKSYPDCDIEDFDLDVQFFTFADGEVGGWSQGNANICALDLPAFQVELGCCVPDYEVLPDENRGICNPGFFGFQIDDPTINFWEWEVMGTGVNGAESGSGANPVNISTTLSLVNANGGPRTVEYTFYGYAGGNCPLKEQTVIIEVYDEIEIELTAPLMCETPTSPYEISPIITGGSGTYTYLWNDANTTTTEILSIDNPSNGTPITLVVTDDAGCTGSATVVLSTYNTFAVDIVPSSTAQCVQSGTIDLDAQPSGGPYPYSGFDWATPSGGANGMTISVNETGQYLVLVTDDQGCVGKDSITLNFFEAPGVDLVVDDPFICPGQATQIFATPYDGNGPYQFAWSDGSSGSFVAAEFPDTYSVIVTDANGCTGTGEIIVAEAEIPSADLGQDIRVCVGEPFPDLSLAGQGTYTQIIWSTGDINVETIPVDTPGTYTVTVLNNEGCQNTGQVNLDFYPLPVLNLVDTILICQGQGEEYDPSDPQWVQYDWGHIPGDDDDPDQFFTQPDLYFLTVWDANGCSAEGAVELVTSDSLIPIIAGPREICAGDTAVLSIEEYFQMEWRDINDQVISTSTSIVTDTAGTFILNVVDDGGCPGEAMVVVTVLEPTVEITGPPVICADAVAQLDAGVGYMDYAWSGGNTNQTLQIDSGGTYMVTVTTPQGCIVSDTFDVVETDLVPVVTGDTFICSDGISILDAGANYASYQWSTGLPGDTLQMLAVNTAGVYTVLVTDQLGCTGSDSFAVDTFPDPVVQVTGDMDFCIGGMAMLNAGSGFVSYSWSTGVPGDTTQLISVNQAGTYTVTVTDLNGCSGTSQMTVNPPYRETAEIQGSLSFCTGSSTTLDAGMNYVSYNWSSGATTQTINVTSGGEYSVIVVDANGCIAMDTVQVTEANELTPQIQGDTALCLGDNIDLSVGNSYSTVLWSTNESTPTITLTNGGIYAVTVTDQSGCTGTDEIQIDENIEPFADVTTSALICNNPADGSIIDFTALITGGETTGSWTDLDATGVDLSDLLSVDFNGIAPNIYQFQYSTVSAVLPCVDQTYIVNVTVLDCACPNVQVDPAGELCNISGPLDLESLFQGTTVTGGTWSLVSVPFGSQPASLIGSIVTTTDGDAGDYVFRYRAPGIPLGCPDTSFTTLTLNAPPEPGMMVASALVCVGTDSAIDLTQLIDGQDAGGEWMETSSTQSSGGAFNANTAIFNTNNQISGRYTFEYMLIGQGSCPDASTTVEVMIEALPVADAGTAPEITCTNNRITLSGENSSQGVEFAYSWSTIDGGPITNPTSITPEVTAPGTYTLSVENTMTGCISFDDVVVTANGEFPSDLIFVLNAPLCEGQGSATIQIMEVTGGTSPFRYFVNGGTPTSDPVIGNLAPGEYSLMVEDQNGCTYETTFNVPTPNIMNIGIEGELFIEEGDSLQLSYIFSGLNYPLPDSIVWKTEDDPEFCINCERISFVPKVDVGEIIVEAYDENGCMVTAKVIFRVAFERTFFIPNVFTPNDDNQNDAFTIYVNEAGATVLSMEIYTRWGEKVFRKENFTPNVPQLGWDGRISSGGSSDPGLDSKSEMLMPGVYVYYIHLIYADEIEEHIKGDITLLR